MSVVIKSHGKEDVEVLWCEGYSVQLQLQTEHFNVRHNQEV